MDQMHLLQDQARLALELHQVQAPFNHPNLLASKYQLQSVQLKDLNFRFLEAAQLQEPHSHFQGVVQLKDHHHSLEEAQVKDPHSHSLEEAQSLCLFPAKCRPL